MVDRPHHIIFDLDGTLIDSKREIIKTYQLVFNDVIPNRTPDFAQIDYGATLNKVLAGVYIGAEAKIEGAKLAFASIYDQSDYSETSLYEGVIETLGWLKAAGHQLYIATNKRRVPTLRILEKKKINRYFSHVVTTDTDPSRILSKEGMVETLKNKFLFLEGFLVGDTAADIEAGKNQNLKTIYAAYGYGTGDSHVTSNSTFIISSFKELQYVFARETQ